MGLLNTILKSNEAINALSKSNSSAYVGGSGFGRQAYNALTGFFGRDISDSALEKAVGKDLTAITNRREKLGIQSMSSLTKEDEAKLKTAKDYRQRIEKNFSDLKDEDKFTGKHVAKFLNEVAGKNREAKRAILADIKASGGKDINEQFRNFYDKQLTTIGNLEQRGNISDMDKLKNMFLDDEGNYSKTKLGMFAAGTYGAANIVGSGSLGIPFISTASWNR